MKLDQKTLGKYGDAQLLAAFLITAFNIKLPLKMLEQFYKHAEAYLMINARGAQEGLICISRSESNLSRFYDKLALDQVSAALVIVKSNRAKAFIIKDVS